MSSKKPVGRSTNITGLKVVKPGRDPRFDDHCGDFNAQLYKKQYAFIDEYKHEEHEQKAKSLKKIRNQETAANVKSELKKQNQEFKQTEKVNKENDLVAKWKNQERKARKEGKTPFYLKKCKLIDLAHSFLQFCLLFVHR